MPKQDPRDFRERAVRLVTESRPDQDTEWSAIRQVATRLGVAPETLRKWVRQAEANAGLPPGVSGSENAEIRQLKTEPFGRERFGDFFENCSTGCFVTPANGQISSIALHPGSFSAKSY